MKRLTTALSCCLACLVPASCTSGPQKPAATSSSSQSQPAAATAASPAQSEPPSPSSSASPAIEVVMASGALQKCLGITRGADRMMKGPQTRQYCEQLPAANVYNQAGERFQAGDHAGAAQIVTKAAEAGNAVAQLRLALMYDQGDGVPQSAENAFTWYLRAANQGEPESQNQVGGFLELSQGIDENWDLAAKLWQASAEQGWRAGQYSFGRAYEFGIGVPQSRQQAIAWFEKAAAQGDPDGRHWAQWLSEPTNNVGFRDGAEHDFVMGPYLRYGTSLMGGDPAGITFHNSAQRALWIKGYSQQIAKDEQEIMRNIHKAEHDACVSGGGSNCNFLRF